MDITPHCTECILEILSTFPRARPGSAGINVFFPGDKKQDPLDIGTDTSQLRNAGEAGEVGGDASFQSK